MTGWQGRAKLRNNCQEQLTGVKILDCRLLLLPIISLNIALSKSNIYSLLYYFQRNINLILKNPSRILLCTPITVSVLSN